MKSRERVLTALDHHEPDRVPIDLGGSVVSSIAIPTYAALRDHLGLPKGRSDPGDRAADRRGGRRRAGHLRRGRDSRVRQSAGRLRPGLRGRRAAGRVVQGRVRRHAAAAARAATTTTGRSSPSPSRRSRPWRRCRGRTPPTRPAIAACAQRVQKLRAGTERALFGMAPCGHDLFNQLLRVRGMERGADGPGGQAGVRRGVFRPAHRHHHHGPASSSSTRWAT